VGLTVLVPACSSSSEAAPAGPSCENGVKDAEEQGVDCGGVCTTKCTGTGCTTNDECGSGKCEGGACAAPAGKPCGIGAAVPTCADGQACELDKDCASGFCDGAKCATPAAESHSDGIKNSGETGIDCGGSVKATKPCPDGEGCLDSGDCVGTCVAGKCGPIGPEDGKKNNGETDIDCGGANAPKCANGKKCETNGDCTDDFCPDATKTCTAPTYDDGVKNGNETDVDCGGAGPGMKKCAEGKVCLVDGDCFGACNYAKKCVDAPSCKPKDGGDTCGYGDVGRAGAVFSHKIAGGDAAGHESCCRTLPVAGYADPNQPGKTVYVDKYEITAGRMRAFLDAVAAQNAGVPNVRGYMAANRPVRWNAGWEGALPSANIGSTTAYTISNPTVNLLYPGQDQYQANMPTQGTWSVASGNFSIDIGLYFAVGAQAFFPEYTPEYAATHNLNCDNKANGYGYGTYWMPADVIQTYGGGVGKYFSKEELDRKALNCTPFAMFAAFCAWDGGQLMTSEVFDYIAGGAWPANPHTATEPPRLAGGRSSNCANNTLNTFPDGTQNCASVYYYPFHDNTNTYDGSSRIAPPGRVLADAVAINAADEPWMDLKGNLHEAVLRAGETTRFAYRGYGVSWSSIVHHRNQETTPRMKGGAFGARCMRFK